MKRLLSAILCAAVLAVFPVGGAWAEAPETFEFPGGITWASTPEEVEAAIDHRGMRHDAAVDGKQTTIIELSNAQYFGSECGRTVFLFDENALQGISCFYAKAALKSLTLFMTMLDAQFGERAEPETIEISSLEEFAAFAFSEHTVYKCQWKLADGTEIRLWDYGEEAEYRYVVSCLSAGAVDPMQSEAPVPTEAPSDLLPSVRAEAPETFEFSGGITWESTPDEVEAILGEGCQREDGADGDVTVTALALDHASYFGFECRRVLFLFVNGDFWSGTCVYSDAIAADTQELADHLSAAYGMAEVRDGAGSSLDLQSFINGGRQLYRWELADGTEISLEDVGEENEYRYMVTFVNTSVSEAVENALDAFADTLTGE